MGMPAMPHHNFNKIVALCSETDNFLIGYRHKILQESINKTTVTIFIHNNCKPFALCVPILMNLANLLSYGGCLVRPAKQLNDGAHLFNQECRKGYMNCRLQLALNHIYVNQRKSNYRPFPHLRQNLSNFLSVYLQYVISQSPALTLAFSPGMKQMSTFDKTIIPSILS